MDSLITLCGDDCSKCPRYLAQTEAELSTVAELWYKIGWRDRVVANEEIRCNGCNSDKNCIYGLVECTKNHNVSKCNKCDDFPCENIRDMLERSEIYKEKCREICNKNEFDLICSSFFNKWENLQLDE